MILFFANAVSAPEMAGQLNGKVRGKSLVWIQHSRDIRAAKLAIASAGNKKALVVSPDILLHLSSVLAIAIGCLLTVTNHSRSAPAERNAAEQAGSIIFYTSCVLGLSVIATDWSTGTRQKD